MSDFVDFMGYAKKAFDSHEKASVELKSREEALERREADIEMREKAFEERLKACAGIQDETIVTFDIGGQLFKYNAEQLRKHPESILCIYMERWMQNGRVPVFPRSALLFAHIDAFLKDVPLPCVAEGGLKAEFDFYGLPWPLPEPAVVPDQQGEVNWVNPHAYSSRRRTRIAN